MTRNLQGRKSVQGQSGYALLLIIFLVALVAVGTMALARQVITTGQREKEEEMIWRGKQYARGVRLYFMKTSRFPTSLEDLTKARAGIRFMRQAYKDPMNSVDGSWRLIYVGATGQPIGSLRDPSLMVSCAQPVAGASSPGLSTDTTGAAPAKPGTSAAPATTSEPEERTNYYGVISGSSVMGVGSKTEKKSFRWYEKAKVYREFEFTWRPGQDSAGCGLNVTSQGTGTPISSDSSNQTPISPPARAPAQTGNPDAGPPPQRPPN